MELGIVFFSIKNKWFKEKMRGWGWILLHLPHILINRIHVQFKIRKISDGEILRLYTGSIKFQEVDSPILKFIVNPLMEVYLWVLKRVVFW